MRVLKKGRNQKGWAKEFTCKADGGCDAILLVEQDDVYKTTHTDYSGTTDSEVLFTCSECKQENVITSNLPFNVQSKDEWEDAQSIPDHIRDSNRNRDGVL